MSRARYEIETSTITFEIRDRKIKNKVWGRKDGRKWIPAMVAVCYDAKIAEIICAALNASEGGVKNRQQAKVMPCLCIHRDLEGMRYDLQIVKECPQHGHFRK